MQKYVIIIYEALKKKGKCVAFSCVWQNPKRSQYSTDRMCSVVLTPSKNH